LHWAEQKNVVDMNMPNAVVMGGLSIGCFLCSFVAWMRLLRTPSNQAKQRQRLHWEVWTSLALALGFTVLLAVYVYWQPLTALHDVGISYDLCLQTVIISGMFIYACIELGRTLRARRVERPE
jgi:peptidoglycan biosynthesis protein MviN/MurJ (putative lipid II flippase)